MIIAKIFKIIDHFVNLRPHFYDTIKTKKETIMFWLYYRMSEITF